MEVTKLDQIRILLEEYKVLYSFYTFRIGSMERIIPYAVIVAAGAMGIYYQLANDIRVIFLLGIPLILVFILNAVSMHIRSFEDTLRRIEAIEHHVNQLSDAELLRFQSTHPSRTAYPGGRGSRDLILAISLLSASVLTICAYLLIRQNYDSYSMPIWAVLYMAYLAVIAGYVGWKMFFVLKYKYVPVQPL